MATNGIKTEYLPEQRAERVEPRPHKTSSSFRLQHREDNSNNLRIATGVPEQHTNENGWVRERELDEHKTMIRAIQLGVTDDWNLTGLVFVGRHPEPKETLLTADHAHLLKECGDHGSVVTAGSSC